MRIISKGVYFEEDKILFKNNFDSEEYIILKNFFMAELFTLIVSIINLLRRNCRRNIFFICRFND